MRDWNIATLVALIVAVQLLAGAPPPTIQETGRIVEIRPGTNVFGRAAQSLMPGDTLIVYPGTYIETIRLSITVLGSAAAPVVIMGAQGEPKPVITRPSSTAVQNTINIEGSAAYLTLRGLEITGNGGDGVTMNGNLSHITLEDLEIHDVDVGVNFRSTMHSITARRNHIYNTGIGNSTGEGMYVGCNNATCIVRDSILEQNWIHDSLPGTTQGDGIEVKVGSHSNIIRDNVIYNRSYPGIFVYGTGTNPPNIVEGNIIWRTLEGIQAAADAIIRNNIVVSSGTGLSLYPHVQVAQTKNITAVHNTLYDNDVGAYVRWSSATDTILANNAIYSPGKQAVDIFGSANVAVANYIQGLSNRRSSAFIDGKGSVAAFVNASGMHFWPKAGSPLIGTASPRHAVEMDFNGTRRLLPADVGAYQTHGLAANPGWVVVQGFKGVK